jgi:hypothetical protein
MARRAAGNAPEVAWTVPGPWRSVERDEPMRQATFLAGGDQQPVEIAVSSFPGNVGGVQANINRWRRQLGMGPTQTPPDPIAEFHRGGLHTQVFEITAPAAEGQDQRKQILVAMLHGRGHTWFVKINDTPKRIDSQQEAMLAFARSFKLKNADEPAKDTQPPEAGAAEAGE